MQILMIYQKKNIILQNFIFLISPSLITKIYYFKKYNKYYALTNSDRKTPKIYSIITYELLYLIDELVRRFDIQTASKMKYYLDHINQFSFLETPLKINKKGEINKDYNIYQFTGKKTIPIF